MRAFHMDYLAWNANEFINAILGAWRRWREHREFSEFARLYPAEAACVAHDLGLNTKELIKISSWGLRWRGALSQRTRRLGLNVETLTHKHPDVIRELTICCARCDSKRRCARDLKADSQSDGWRKYCPNQQTLEALMTGQDTRRPGFSVISRVTD